MGLKADVKVSQVKANWRIIKNINFAFNPITFKMHLLKLDDLFIRFIDLSSFVNIQKIL